MDADDDEIGGQQGDDAPCAIAQEGELLLLKQHAEQHAANEDEYQQDDLHQG